MKWIGRIAAVVLTVLSFVAASSAARPPSASQVLSAAREQAAAQHKNIFLVFGASWCGPCHLLEQFVSAPEIAPVLQKYFIFARLNVAEENGEHPEMESPDAAKLLAELGGEKSGIPVIVFLDPEGNKLADSNRPAGGKARFENIGYPDTREEIAWFMAMLKAGAPGMTEDERRIVDVKLRLAGRH